MRLRPCTWCIRVLRVVNECVCVYVSHKDGPKDA